MRAHFILAILIGSLFLFGCKKDYLIDVDENYQGEWLSEPSPNENGILLEKYFRINGQEGAYGEFCEVGSFGTNCTYSVNGNAKVSKKGTTIFIGPFGSNANITITEAPHLNDDDEWECTLNSTVFTRN